MSAPLTSFRGLRHPAPQPALKRPRRYSRGGSTQTSRQVREGLGGGAGKFAWRHVICFVDPCNSQGRYCCCENRCSREGQHDGQDGR